MTYDNEWKILSPFEILTSIKPFNSMRQTTASAIEYKIVITKK